MELGKSTAKNGIKREIAWVILLGVVIRNFKLTGLWFEILTDLYNLKPVLVTQLLDHIVGDIDC